MNLEFDILKKPLEAELTHEDRTKPRFLFFGIIIVVIFLLPISNNDNFFFLKIFVSIILLIILLKKNTNRRSELDIIKENLVDKLIVQAEPFKIVNSLGENIIGNDFEGNIIIKYEGYFKEIEGNTRNPNVYYGTQNQIIINNSGSKKRYFIYIKGSEGRRNFFKLVELLFSNNIEFKEFSRGERTYFGKKLNYKEIQKLKKINKIDQ